MKCRKFEIVLEGRSFSFSSITCRLLTRSERDGGADHHLRLVQCERPHASEHAERPGLPGSGVQLRDLLARHGWDTETGVAAVVATVTPGTGKIQGLRWATCGPVISGTLQMKNLFILCWR